MGKVKLEELVIELTLENKSLVKQMKSSQQATEKASKNMSKSIGDFTKNSTKNTQRFQKVFETMAGFIGGAVVIGAFNKMTGAAKQLFNTLVTEGVAAAQVQEDAIQKLNTSLALAGQFSTETSKDFQEFASSLQQTTKFGDEVILQNAALIESLGQLDAEGLKKATIASLDMAAALGIDLKAATTLVGKAATGEISSFTRYGLIIEKGKDAAETFANTLDALNSKFGGAAQAQVKTFSGAVTQLSNTFGDFTEEIGFTITQNQAVLNVIKQVNSIISDGSTSVKDQNSAMKELVAEGLIRLIDGVILLSVAFDSVGRAAGAFADLIEKSFADIGVAGSGLLTLFSDDFDDAFNAFTAQSKAAADSFDDRFTKDTFLSDVTVQLNEMKIAAEQGLGAIKSGAETLVEPTNVAKEAVQGLSDAQQKMADDGLKLTETLLLNLEGENVLRQELLQERHDSELEQLQLARSNQLITEDEHLIAVRELNNKFDEDELERKKKMDKFEQQRSQGRLKAASVFFGGFAALAALGGKKTFLLAKRLSQAQAIVDGVAAVQRALANPPGPPFNALIVAGTIAQTTANVARIENQKLQTGIDSVPGIGSADNFPALLAPRERVVPAETNKDLKQFLLDQTVIDEQPKQTINQFIFQGPIIGDESAGLAIIDLINQALENTGARLAT